MEEREEGLSVAGKRKPTIMTMFGSLATERRLCRGEDGNYRFLPDEAIGLPSGSRFSALLSEMALEFSSRNPFRYSARVVSRFTGEKVGHMTLCDMVSSCGDEKNEKEEEKRTALFEDGELPPSENREADRLPVEADGAGIALQRQKKRGMGWTIKGADRMARAIQPRANDQLPGWVRSHAVRQAKQELLEPAVTKLRRRIKKDPERAAFR